jgi:hypothetical protein
MLKMAVIPGKQVSEGDDSAVVPDPLPPALDWIRPR